ncbi:MAG: F0F1 ATP synthase subunit A [Eubacteriales bacterium]
MNKRQKQILFVTLVTLAVIAALIAVVLVTQGQPEKDESLGEVMRDAVLHEQNKVSLFGLPVNLSVASGFLLTGVLLFLALLARLFVIPRFRDKPGRLQSLLELPVSFFEDLAKKNSPTHYRFLGAYVFGAGVYIFAGTLMELFGIQVLTTAGHSVSLPAVLADINAALAMGFLSYGVILVGGLCTNRVRGGLHALKDFSLPVSMSFRLFGALLSGLLVSELVYYFIYTGFVLPVLVAVLFTLLHAVIQTYVLTLLTALFFGEATEPHHKEPHQKNKRGGAPTPPPAGIPPEGEPATGP